VVTWIGVHQLGYAEFGEMQRTLRYGVGNQRRAMGNNIYLASLVQRFVEMPDPSHLWGVVIEAVARLDFQHLEIVFERPAADQQTAFPAWSAEGAEARHQPSSQWRIPVEGDGELLATIVVTRSLQKQVEFDPAYLLHALNAGFGPRLCALVRSAPRYTSDGEPTVSPSTRVTLRGLDA
jgi:hypothetical protein